MSVAMQSPPRASELAIFGGPKCVSEPYEERWRRVHPSDLERIAECANRDETTSAGSDGPVGEFEAQFRQMTGSKYALAMNSGTATLHSAYFAVGVKPGDQVIVPAYTWFASASPLLQLGATPVFCDIDERTLTADPEDVERRITERTKAICVVHVWGNPARLDRFVEIARRYNVALIEDCSHAHGAVYQGKPVGSWGDVGCFSLQGEKPVSAGEGGIAVTDDPGLFDRMLALGHNGRTQNGQAANSFQIGLFSLGLKFRPHLYGILLAMGSLERLPELNKRRRRNYQFLCDQLASCDAIRPIETCSDAIRGGLFAFVFRFRPGAAGNWNRNAFVHAVKAEGVPIAPARYTHWEDGSRLLHQSNVFSKLDYEQFGGAMRFCDSIEVPTLPVSEQLADELVSLPPFTNVSESYLRQCARAMTKVARVAAGCEDLRL